ncbi:hypothetical protein GFD17_04450 [Bifidobacterium sp. SMB2]|uniref:Uncharacterized protein n=1 Tax=Bifidobacterium saimiriisciurei TaxID=2661627 RepID=A0ABX0C9C8_9BIFI|nr:MULTISPECIES: hypothetical protein [Bifidobacterium]NEG96020.1 hypothetical protein [Bifidobacterium sp. SMB2]NEH10902.1 hypothetical protein [Bifidobacterium saimiriisciurei]
MDNLPVWQKTQQGIINGGLPAGSGKEFNLTWPKPFKATPSVVVATPGDAWMVVSVDNVTAKGCTLGVRNYAAAAKPNVAFYQAVYAYGVLA